MNDFLKKQLESDAVFKAQKEIESSTLYKLQKQLESDPIFQMQKRLESDPFYQIQKRLESDPFYKIQQRLESDPVYRIQKELEQNTAYLLQRRLNDTAFGQLYDNADLNWLTQSTNQFQIFESQIENAATLLNTDVDANAKNTLLIMLHGFIVAALEGYLSSTFIHHVTNSEILTKKLVESDDYFAGISLKLSEIFEKKDAIKTIVASYLQTVIFHNVNKTNFLYKAVFEVDFGKIDWFYKAVVIRHDCVHRAGFDKEGNGVELSKESILTLISKSKDLVAQVETRSKELNSASVE
jgi:hypothetical protein